MPSATHIARYDTSVPTYVGSIGDLNQLVTWLNESFDNCQVTAGALSYLSR